MLPSFHDVACHARSSHDRAQRQVGAYAHPLDEVAPDSGRISSMDSQVILAAR